MTFTTVIISSKHILKNERKQNNISEITKIKSYGTLFETKVTNELKMICAYRYLPIDKYSSKLISVLSAFKRTEYALL